MDERFPRVITTQPGTIYNDLKPPSYAWEEAPISAPPGYSTLFDDNLLDPQNMASLHALRKLNECRIVGEKDCCYRGGERAIMDMGGTLLYQMNDIFVNSDSCGNAYGDIETVLQDADGMTICTIERKAYLSSWGCQEGEEIGRSTIFLTTDSGGKQEVTWLKATSTGGSCGSSIDFEFDAKLGDLTATVPSLGGFTCSGPEEILLQVCRGDNELCNVRNEACCDQSTQILEFTDHCNDVRAKLAILAAFVSMMQFNQQREDGGG